jgi:hypothetical protein
MNNHIPLVPKHPDGKLRVLAIGRLSKPKSTEEETQKTIESSLEVVRRHLDAIYDGPVLLTQLAEQESGLIADRATIQEAEELIAGGEVDLLIAEDLSRIYRSPRLQYAFVEDCVDSDVRVICVADRLDTEEDDWESSMCIASFRHSMPAVDARRRQVRKSHYSFHNGGQVQKVKAPYRKLTTKEAKSGKFGPVGLRIARREEWTPIVKKMREILMTPIDGVYSYVPVLEWLRENNIPTGAYVKSDEWTQRLVKSLLTDPILIGLRRFRVLLFRRVRGSKKYRRRLNPKGPETELYPELAHLTDEEFESMQAIIEQIASNHRDKAGAEHSLYRRPRKDALFPKQHATCSICGGMRKCPNSC